jgi:endonuclease/exonuclease/phosphatase family metal-dependent hydrolase
LADSKGRSARRIVFVNQFRRRCGRAIRVKQSSHDPQADVPSADSADQFKPIEEPDAIYTAVAIRKSEFSDVSCFEFGGLSIDHTEDEVTRKVRGGTGEMVTIGGKKLTLLSIHLKSSCSKQKIDPPATKHCKTLGEQLPLLNEWIDTEIARSANVIIAGDFNRVMEFAGDQFWPRFDDSNPAALNLFRIPLGSDSDASNTCVDRPWQIDYIVFPKEIFDGVGEVLV